MHAIRTHADFSIINEILQPTMLYTIFMYRRVGVITAPEKSETTYIKQMNLSGGIIYGQQVRIWIGAVITSTTVLLTTYVHVHVCT